jgi:hypothetical protein
MQELLAAIHPDAVLLADTGATELPTGEFGGLDVKPDARRAAADWNPMMDQTVATVCLQPSIIYSMQGPFPIEILQGTELLVIKLEYFDHVRVVFLDGRDHPEGPYPHSMQGHSVGHWDGDTLVVETRNFTDKLNISRYAHSEDLVLTERFTRIDPDMLNYVVTVDDPKTFERPWSFRLTLTTQPGYEILEYSCHEGNFFVANALRAEMLYQQSVAEAMANGDPIPARSVDGGGGLSIYEAPSASDAVDINAGE